MDLFTYLMAKNDHNTSVNNDLFSYLLGKGQSGTYQTFTGTSISANNTKKGKMKLSLKGNTSQTGTPTPSSPIPVNVVSGDNEIVVCGNNILPLSANDLTFNAYISNTGVYATTTSGNYYASAEYIDFAYTGNITLSTGLEIAFYDSNKSFLYYTSRTSPRTQAIPNNTAYIRIDSYKDNINEMMINLGSTALPYEAYTGTSYPINLPVENLLDKTTCQVGKNWNGNNLAYSIASDYIEVQEGETYTFSVSNMSAYSSVTIVALDSSKSYLNSYSNQTNTFSTAGTKYVVISIRSANTHTWTEAELNEANIQFEKGSKANSYTPYGTTPIELCKIGDYQDYFTKNSDGQWCKYNAIGKVVLDGSEDWTLNQTKTYVNQYLSISSLSDNIATGTSYIMSDYFKYKQADPTDTTNEDYMWLFQKRLVLDIRKTIVADTTALKTWVGTNRPTFYYQLATPYLTLIEDNNLIEQLDNLQNAMSYNGQTNINQTNNDLPFEIEAEIKVKS